MSYALVWEVKWMLSENIYALRRKSGLSQEALAEKIGVSRQSISKWETGAATPELEKLKALCSCFGVTLDELIGDGAPVDGDSRPDKAPEAGRPGGALGIVLCVGGAVCLALYGALALLRPAAAERISESSVVTLDGSGLLLLAFIALMAAGAVLIFRRK